MAIKRDVESGVTGRPGRERHRWRPGGGPPTERGARARHGAAPRDHPRHPGARGGQHEPPARRQVERRRLPPDLDQDGAQRAAAQGFVGGAQRAEGIASGDEDHPAGTGAELGKAGRVEAAELPCPPAVAYPDDAARLARRPERQRQRKPAGRGGVPGVPGMNLMQLAARKPAPQMPVEASMAEHERGPRIPVRDRLKGGKTLSQDGKGGMHGIAACIHDLFSSRLKTAAESTLLACWKAMRVDRHRD